MRTIEQLAREAGLVEGDYGGEWSSHPTEFGMPWEGVATNGLERFAALVRAQALAEAAEIVYQVGAWRGGHGEPGAAGPDEIATAIRAAAQEKAMTDAPSDTQPLSDEELAALVAPLQGHPLYEFWRRVMARDAAHFARFTFGAQEKT